jgi:hypothetical protein
MLGYRRRGIRCFLPYFLSFLWRLRVGVIADVVGCKRLD